MLNRMLSLKEISKLDRKRSRDELGVFLIEGKKLIEEAAAAQAPILQVLATEKFAQMNRAFLAQVLPAFRATIISDHHAELLTGTKTPTGVFAIIGKQEITLNDVKTKKLVAILENIRDPGNLGTMIRTADWFGVEAVIVSEDGADVYNDKVIRASMGSLFHFPIYSSAALVRDVEDLQVTGFQILVTQPEAKANHLAKLPAKLAIVMGNESIGTTAKLDHLANYTYAIPKFGHAESLNVAVSFGIILNDLLQLSEQKHP